MDKTTKNSGAHIQRLNADVLLVTVTEVETRAVLAAVEKEVGHECKPLYIGHKTYYDLGTIGGARTFLIRSEMGSGGSGGSQSTVQAGIDALSPSSVIMVGIAFGIDSEKQRIGDILISQQLQEYELQRVGTGPDGELRIIPRGERVGASPRLLDRFRDGALFWKASRTQFGLILSGQKLIDNIQFRNELIRRWPEAIGGEMEGAGVYAAVNVPKVDWILVKAICDWADGRKSENKKQRQEEAARNAASFTIYVVQRGGFSEDELGSAEQAKSIPSPSTGTNGTLQQNNDTKAPLQQLQGDNMPTKRNIVIAYSENDAEIALELGAKIESALEEDRVYVDLFDLDGGGELASVVSASARADNWFVLLASESSAQSHWITHEARLMTFLEIEHAGYHILIIRLDSSPFPKELDMELRSRRCLEVDGHAEQAIERAISVLHKSRPRHPARVAFFVNRGSELDQLELEATREKVIYVVG